MEKYTIPQVDIIEEKENYKLYMDMPGIKKENINIDLNDNELTITGKFEKPNSDWKYIFGNREFYDYKRSYQINNKIDSEKISADYHDGVLTVTLPKKPEAQPKKIEIK